MTWNKTAARSNGGGSGSGGSGTATAPTRTPVTVRNVVAEAAQESALRRQEIQALLEEYARKQEASAAPSSGGAAAAATPAPATATAPKTAPVVASAAARPAAAKSGTPMTPASIDRRLQSLETAIARIETKISGGVRGDKVEEIASIVEDLLVKIRSLRG